MLYLIGFCLGWIFGDLYAAMRHGRKLKACLEISDHFRKEYTKKYMEEIEALHDELRKERGEG